MAENDNLVSLLLGVAIGGIGAQPGVKEKDKIRKNDSFWLKYSTRTKQLEPLESENIGKLPVKLGKLYFDAVKLYGLGFYRWSCGCSSLLIESILRKQLKENNFNTLINKAHEAKILSATDYHFLHGLRHERNDFLHDFEKVPTMDDAKMLFIIAKRMVNKLKY